MGAKKKSIAGGGGGGARKSVAKKSITGGPKKSIGGAKKSIGGAKKSSMRKSVVGGSKSRASLKRKDAGGETFGEYEQFWKKLNLDMQDRGIAEEMKDVAVITLDPDKAVEAEKQAAGGDATELQPTISTHLPAGYVEEVVYNKSADIVYDISKQLRNKAFYSKHITVKNVACDGVPVQRELKPTFVSKYHSLADLIPMKSVTIEYMLFCMVEHVGSIMDTSDMSVGPFPSSRSTCQPPFIFHRDSVALDSLRFRIDGIDLPHIHRNIHRRMPYSTQWQHYHYYADPLHFQCKSHFYKLWRSVEGQDMPEDLFRVHVNHLVFHKVYNLTQEPPMKEDQTKYETFVPIVTEISKVDPFSFKNERFIAEAYKLKSFLECQEILSLFSFPLHSTSTLQYNFIEEMDDYALLQQLNKCYANFQTTYCIYFPPTDSLLVWFNNYLNFTELNGLKIRGVLRTPVGFADYYKYVQYEEARWIASKKGAIEEENNKITSEYKKMLARLKRLKGYEPTVGDDVQVPLPKIEIGNGDHREVYDLGSFRVESEEEATDFNSIDGTRITVKKCRWVKGGKTELIVTVDSFGSVFRMSRIVSNENGEAGADDGNVGVELTTEAGDVVSYRIKKTAIPSMKPEETGEKKGDNGGKRKSFAGRKSAAGRKSMAGRNSIGKPGGKSQEGKPDGAPQPVETVENIFQVTSPTGLQSFFSTKHGEKFVRQEFSRDINKDQAPDEDHRLFLRDGTILVYKNNGNVSALYPYGQYLNIQEVKKVSTLVYRRPDGTVVTDPQTIRRFLGEKEPVAAPGEAAGPKKQSTTKRKSMGKRKSSARKSTKRKSSVKRQSKAGARKSSMKRQSKAGARKSMTLKPKIEGETGAQQKQETKPEEPEVDLEAEEVMYYDIVRYDWVDHFGKETHFERGKAKVERPNAHRIRIAVDSKGQLYATRTDGVKMFFRDDATLHTRYGDGTLLTSQTEMADYVTGEEEQMRRTSKRNSPSPEEPAFVMYKTSHDMEHPEYYRVSSGDEITIHLPGNVAVVNPSEKSYAVTLKDSTSCDINDQTVMITCKHPHASQTLNGLQTMPELIPILKGSRSASVHSKRFQADARLTKVEIQLTELQGKEKVQLLRAADSAGRVFQVFSDGSTEFTPALNSPAESFDHCFSHFNKFFVVSRTLNGYELINEDEHQGTKCAKPYDIEPFDWAVYDEDHRYVHRELKPASMQKKELSRYLEFPKDQWYFNSSKFVDPCETFNDPQTVTVKPPPKAVLWRTRRRLRCQGYDPCTTIRKALFRYELYHLRTLKKYLNYLSTYEPGYVDVVDIPFRHRPLIGPLSIENVEEKRKLEAFENVRESRSKGIWEVAVRK